MKIQCQAVPGIRGSKGERTEMYEGAAELWMAEYGGAGGVKIMGRESAYEGGLKKVGGRKVRRDALHPTRTSCTGYLTGYQPDSHITIFLFSGKESEQEEDHHCISFIPPMLDLKSSSCSPCFPFHMESEPEDNHGLLPNFLSLVGRSAE